MNYINKILISCVLFFICYASAFSHKEWVHQHITKEAYKLLYNEFGNIPYLAVACGFDNNGNENCNYETVASVKSIDKNHPLLNGIWIEDTDDILFEKNNNWPAVASANHFWNADLGDEEKENLDAIYYTEEFNSLQKAYYYLNCTSEDMRIDHYNIKVPLGGFLSGNYIQTKNIYIKYNNLFEFYSSGEVIFSSYDWDNVDRFQDWSKNYPPSISNINQLPKFTPKINSEVYSLSIFGRILHLLTDQSVPAHVHTDTHPCNTFLGILQGGDLFELNMGHGLDEYGIEKSWDANQCDEIPKVWENESFIARRDYSFQTARQNGGLIWEAFENYTNDKTFLRYLFYNLNQLADAFPSINSQYPASESHLGDLATGVNYYDFSPWLENQYTNLDNSRTSNMDYQGQVLYNTTIRIAATYLYWVSYKLGWLNYDQNMFCPTGQKDMTTSTNIKNHHFYSKVKTETQPYQYNVHYTTFYRRNVIRAGNVPSNGPSDHGFPDFKDIPSGPVIVDKDADVRFYSKAEVRLEDGFHAKAGSNFHAKIQDVACQSNINVFNYYKNNQNNELQYSQFQNDFIVNKLKNEFNIYPNPAKDLLNLTFINNNIIDEKDLTIKIINSMGISELESDFKFHIGTNNYNLNIENLQNGIYSVILKTSNTQLMQRLVILK